MKKLSPVKILLGMIGLAIGVVGVLALREATLSTHQAVGGRGAEIIVSAQIKGAERGQTLDEIVEAQLNACRLEVTSDLVGEVEPLGDGRYRAVLEPAMDQTNKRQFRGCVEDWIIDHVRIDVLSLDTID